MGVISNRYLFFISYLAWPSEVSKDKYFTPMKYRLHLILLIFLLVFVSCNSEDSDECTENRTAYITAIDAPDSTQINEPVLVGVYNGCGQFGKFIESIDENVRTIAVEARYSGCMCTQDAPIRTIQYEFVTSETGLYTLKFKSGLESFIEWDIAVIE